MSEIQETTQDQSVQSPTNEAKTNGTPLAEYIKSLFRPLNETIEHIDWMETQDEFNAHVYRDALCFQIDSLDKILSAIGDALDEAVESTIFYDSDSINFTLQSINNVSIHSDWDVLGGIFRNNHDLLTGVGELLRSCNDIEALDWAAISHMLTLSLDATERHMLDACEKVKRTLGEVSISEQNGKKGKEILHADVEHAGELIKAARKIEEERAESREEKCSVHAELNSFLCVGCPVLADLIASKKELPNATIMFQVKSLSGKLTAEWWTTATDDMGMTSGCLRKLLERVTNPDWKDIELAPCPKLTDGTGMCQMTADAGQEV